MSLYCTLYAENPRDGVSYDEEEVLKLERNWDMLNFLFTGLRFPDDKIRGFLVSDWLELAPEAHLIESDSIRSISSWLSRTSDQEIMDRFDPTAMVEAEVYDCDLVIGFAVEYREALTELLISLRKFLALTAERNCNVVRVLS